MLGDIWPKWQAIAASTIATSVRIDATVKNLYEIYDLPTPEIRWLDDPRQLPLTTRPMITHFRDSLIYSAWPKLADPSWVCSQIGYDRREHVFRLPENKRKVLSRSRITGVGGRRPRWLTDGANVISQFDVDALAIHELASKLFRTDATLNKLAKVITQLITSCFAAILYEDLCLLIKKPSSIVLNENHLLSAQKGPAVEWAESNIRYFFINGEFLGEVDPPKFGPNFFHEMNAMSAANRVLHIEYMGWDAFYELMLRNAPGYMRLLSKDRWGSLHTVLFHNQQFTFVRVKNRTAESDGKFQHFVIPVDPNCRPLPDPNKPFDTYGPRQVPTALNAVASTFGMTGKEYAEMLGAES